MILDKFKLIALYGLTLREVKKFLKIYNQTMFVPATYGLMLLLLFGGIIDASTGSGIAKKVAMHGFSAYSLLVPGVAMMLIIRYAFSHSVASFMIAKVAGYMNDYIVPPFNGHIIIGSFILSAIIRMILATTVFLLLCLPFYGYKAFPYGGIYNWWNVISFLILATTINSLLGVIGGIVCRNFDDMAIMENYIIAPLSMFSGVFFTIEGIPENFRLIAQYNPFFHMIDGFRYGFCGISEFNVGLEFLYLLGWSVVLYIFALWVVNSSKFFQQKR